MPEHSHSALKSSNVGTSSPSPILYWRDLPVPPILVTWFDQLVSSFPIISVASQSNRYLDVTLTCGSSGAFAKPPQILIK